MIKSLRVMLFTYSAYFQQSIVIGLSIDISIYPLIYT